MRTLHVLSLVAAGLAGCSSAASMGAGGTGGGAGAAGRGGNGGTIITLDASAAAADAASGVDGSVQALTPNLSGDAPTFNWDTRTCVGCTDAGGGSSGAGGGAAGSGSGGSSSSSSGGSSSGGKSGSGGMSAGSGGAMSSGGRTSAGGAMGTGGMTAGMGGSAGGGGSAADAGRPSDGPPWTQDATTAGPDLVVSTDVLSIRDGAADILVGPDAGKADAWGADATVPPTCVARVRALVPATTTQGTVGLVAGPNTQVVLRAEIVSGGPAAPSWVWQATRNGTQVVNPTYGLLDTAAAAFSIPYDGDYVFLARDQSMRCSASLVVSAVASDACPECDPVVNVRAAPPPSADIPVQTGPKTLKGSPPFSGENVVPSRGESVLISPSVGATKVDSYVRVNNVDGILIADGMAATSAGFGARLLALNGAKDLLYYDVLVVPINGVNGSTVAATAPQLFQSMTPGMINTANFGLSGGVDVSGRLTTSTGSPVPNGRVILTNRDPTLAKQTTDLIFSSVGSADAQGNFLLHAQRGQYWVSFSPPNGSGLAEGLAPSAITLTGNTQISFQWTAPAMAGLTLNVQDASFVPLAGARVRLTSAQPAKVGTATLTGAGTTVGQEANGNVRVEGTTGSDGRVAFASLPAGVAYNALIMPPTLGPNAATTVRSVMVSAAGAEQTVQAQPQGTIRGKLLPVAADWAKAHLLVYDRSLDTPEAPQLVGVSPEGNFTIGASPGRPYVVMVVPDAGSGLARTFVGPGALQTSEFPITQKVQSSMPWTAKVMTEYQVGLAGTALQVFCMPGYPYCVDPTLPLAETTAGEGGAFQLALPDPASR